MPANEIALNKQIAFTLKSLSLCHVYAGPALTVCVDELRGTDLKYPLAIADDADVANKVRFVSVIH